jgi:putative NADH-flavin reductase
MPVFVSSVCKRILLLAGVLVAFASEAQPLDILVYGATGRIGSLVTDEALARGHQVTAVSRDPSQIQVQHANLMPARGDLLDMGSIASLAAGKDVIVVAVRGVIGDKLPENALQRIAVENIVAVLRASDGSVPRLIHVGGAGSLLTESGDIYADRLPKILLPKAFEAELFGQVLALEYLRGIAAVRWTYITPPRNFTNGERTGSYRIGGDAMLEDDRGRSRISRADFAAAVIDEAEAGAHINARMSVAY